MQCRFCKTLLKHEFINLGNAPASNSFLTAEQLNETEVFYPLRVLVCDNCFLVQIDEYKKSNAIFSDEYVYFSSYSTSWLAHAKNYVEMVEKRFSLNKNSLAVEIASNDGYLLQYLLLQLQRRRELKRLPNSLEPALLRNWLVMEEKLIFC
jgi:Putative zinc binding domain